MRRSRASAEATATREVTKPDEQWRQELTPLQYNVLRKAHTEMPSTGAYLHNHRDGFYRCAGCGARLFSSDAKFHSGTGWPSFDQPAVAEAVELRPDNGLFMRRTEVVCRRCGGHLGHVFNDGRIVEPEPAGLGQLRHAFCSEVPRLIGQPGRQKPQLVWAQRGAVNDRHASPVPLGACR